MKKILKMSKNKTTKKQSKIDNFIPKTQKMKKE